jgi:hypothetical protein
MKNNKTKSRPILKGKTATQTWAQTMYEMHTAIAYALREEGLEAEAYKRENERQRGNIVIKLKNKGIILTAFVDGQLLAIGNTNLYLYQTFDLNDPDTFTNITHFLNNLQNHHGHETEHGLWFRDDRFYLGDMTENWIKHTDNWTKT